MVYLHTVSVLAYALRTRFSSGNIFVNVFILHEESLVAHRAV